MGHLCGEVEHSRGEVGRYFSRTFKDHKNNVQWLFKNFQGPQEQSIFKDFSSTFTLSPVFFTEVRAICTALPMRRTVIERHCNGVETTQPGDQPATLTSWWCLRYQLSQRVSSLAKVTFISVRHKHSRLQLDKRLLFSGLPLKIIHYVK